MDEFSIVLANTDAVQVIVDGTVYCDYGQEMNWIFRNLFKYKAYWVNDLKICKFIKIIFTFQTCKIMKSTTVIEIRIQTW